MLQIVPFTAHQTPLETPSNIQSHAYCWLGNEPPKNNINRESGFYQLERRDEFDCKATSDNVTSKPKKGVIFRPDNDFDFSHKQDMLLLAMSLPH